jgi:hypothetical protein
LAELAGVAVEQDVAFVKQAARLALLVGAWVAAAVGGWRRGANEARARRTGRELLAAQAVGV